MSKANEIRREIKKILQSHKELQKQDLVDSFPKHEPLIGYVLHKAVSDGELVKLGSTRGAKYSQVNFGAIKISKSGINRIYQCGEQSESDIFHEMQDEFLNQHKISENASSIVPYAFTEMVNNAIDHSQSEKIEVAMDVQNGQIRFTVRDWGIGVFENVRQSLDLPSERLALAELTKGKFTTSPKWHSGEGIFFTSRAADLFRLTGGNLTLERNNTTGALNVIENEAPVEGTLVEFVVSADTNRSLSRDVFNQFEIESGANDFGKTEITVRLFDRGNILVSRSQAKRIMAGTEKFSVVMLDFDGVPLIGQGFADEIFRIFVRENPNTKVLVKNAGPDVQMMIDRVENTRR
ncbi:MAG: DUF4325 domain-containing protein [Patescibacteria group bacterium]